ncbi:MAG TPA: hypothetical protein VMS60_16100 [Solirubrobacterales bacterium]|nr:hypothetical protein [Solirubrobacterales bacterium]
MKLRPSPATVIAVIALVISLTGTAYAAGVFTKKQKKQVTTIATKVFDSKIGGASVKRAETAGKAETADKALTAEKATEATKAMQALRATEATRADVATKAGEATKATEADTATEAAHADEATRATTAGNAEQLGGKPAADFQDRVDGSCAPPNSISSVGADGTVGCTTPVEAIRIELGPGGGGSVDLANGLQVRALCSTPNMSVGFKNTGGVSGNLNRVLSNDTATTVQGAALQPEATQELAFSGQTEGQLVWSPLGGDTTTLILHIFRRGDGGFCEVTGTAMTGLR